ncbi:delta-aminolevulinic acid dehydratase [Robertmurraya sp. DFI.2.37]|uniref:delta-aminolevulinic acid dehydratase n=1 Tax=Robertmurraya sp. DFI.2.37 TaxID=3031819 RepID=UPI0012459E0C|nr:delta-aminolevulinic acid dehydratase [Robertmurraya sp. DFI.2.37]MDF1508648.1 delta-aminolevulinic acid dehydratase [Robertmurraya sp. DFI.2.37]
MSMPSIDVTLAVGPDSALEAQAIRSGLEVFNVRVITYWIGRPNDLIKLITENESDYLILSFHGVEGELVMPELGEMVYEDNEPKKNFGATEILEYGRLNKQLVIGNGCTLGDPELANAFLKIGCRAYIGPKDCIDGDASFYFIIRFFYELLSNQRSEKEAYELAKSTDQETCLYEWYSSEIKGK